MVNYYNYFDDVMIMRAFANNIQEIFLVPKINDEREFIDVPNANPSHNTLFITYLVNNTDNDKDYFPTVVFPRNVNERDKSPIIFEFVNNKLRLYISERLHKSILDYLRQIIANENKPH